jgi:hypothetical protein
MDFINRATGRTGPLPDGVPFSKIFSLGHIDSRIQKHLQKVRRRGHRGHPTAGSSGTGRGCGLPPRRGRAVLRGRFKGLC